MVWTVVYEFRCFGILGIGWNASVCRFKVSRTRQNLTRTRDTHSSSHLRSQQIKPGYARTSNDIELRVPRVREVLPKASQIRWSTKSTTDSIDTPRLGSLKRSEIEDFELRSRPSSYDLTATPRCKLSDLLLANCLCAQKRDHHADGFGS